MNKIRDDRRSVFLLKVKVPEGASRAQTMRYVREALKSHGGGYPPDDPFFGGLKAAIKVPFSWIE